MARTDETPTFWGNMLAAGLYKRNQGRLTRQLTAAGIALVIFFGAWTLSQGMLSSYDPPVRIGVPLVLSVLGMWLAFRVVNLPQFADFLISVEAEMDKVAWSSRQELYRATVVVITTMVLLGIILLLYDFIWVWFFTAVRILKPMGS
jgi:preprotein translocase subunit SecE